MAKDDKKAKSSKAKAVRNIAKFGMVGPHPKGLYTKYGDFNPEVVHTGAITYRGVTVEDHPASNKNTFATNIRRASGGSDMKGFIFQNKLYKYTKTGTNAEHVEVSR
tara:strand:+ start:2728 stop:3048 length:321 start_codon:yes stop_codon:yes gene_type:complete